MRTRRRMRRRWILMMTMTRNGARMQIIFTLPSSRRKRGTFSLSSARTFVGRQPRGRKRLALWSTVVLDG
jgi:hypothetical protein